MSAVSSPVHDEDEVRIKEETRFSFVQDIQRQADRVAKGLILKEQDYNSPKIGRKPRFVPSLFRLLVDDDDNDDAASLVAFVVVVENSRVALAGLRVLSSF